MEVEQSLPAAVVEESIQRSLTMVKVTLQKQFQELTYCPYSERGP